MRACEPQKTLCARVRIERDGELELKEHRGDEHDAVRLEQNRGARRARRVREERHASDEGAEAVAPQLACGDGNVS